MLNRFFIANKQWETLIEKNEALTNVLRWYNHVQSQEFVKKAVQSLPDEAKVALNGGGSARTSEERTTVRPQEGKFVDLPGAEMGKVVVRFPPEASG